MKLLQEILSDYPRIWEFYKNNTDHERAPKYAQRYPLPMGTLSMIVDFHKWTHATSNLVSDSIGIELPKNVRKVGVGPDPVIMIRIQWLDNNWGAVETRKKSLAKTLGDEILNWHTKIRIKVNDGDFYSYESGVICQTCLHRSVVRMNDSYICVNTACRNPLTGEFCTWHID